MQQHRLLVARDSVDRNVVFWGTNLLFFYLTSIERIYQTQFKGNFNERNKLEIHYKISKYLYFIRASRQRSGQIRIGRCPQFVLLNCWNDCSEFDCGLPSAPGCPKLGQCHFEFGCLPIVPIRVDFSHKFLKIRFYRLYPLPPPAE